MVQANKLSRTDTFSDCFHHLLPDSTHRKVMSHKSNLSHKFPNDRKIIACAMLSVHISGVDDKICPTLRSFNKRTEKNSTSRVNLQPLHVLEREHDQK